jgi:hypothetical protein
VHTFSRIAYDHGANILSPVAQLAAEHRELIDALKEGPP